MFLLKVALRLLFQIQNFIKAPLRFYKIHFDIFIAYLVYEYVIFVPSIFFFNKKIITLNLFSSIA